MTGDGHMNDIGIVKRNIVRADRAAVEKLARFGVATVHEALGRTGLMKPYLRPVYPGARLCGTAVTVLLQPGVSVPKVLRLFDTVRRFGRYPPA